jgi:hypothetical protein
MWWLKPPSPSRLSFFAACLALRDGLHPTLAARPAAKAIGRLESSYAWARPGRRIQQTKAIFHWKMIYGPGLTAASRGIRVGIRRAGQIFAVTEKSGTIPPAGEGIR